MVEIRLPSYLDLCPVEWQNMIHGLKQREGLSYSDALPLYLLVKELGTYSATYCNDKQLAIFYDENLYHFWKLKWL